MAEILQKPLAFLLIAVLIFNLSQRRHLSYGEKKRIATLLIAGAILFLYIIDLLIIRFHLSPLYLIPATLIIILFFLNYRKAVLPFSINCDYCGKRLSIKRVLYHDSNMCANCESGEK